MAADAWFLIPIAALLLSLLALAPLGVQVLRRGVVFIDLAVAQASAAATLLCGAFLAHPNGWQSQLAATLGALACALMVSLLCKLWPAQREALIGLLYVIGATLALIAASADPHGKERIASLLATDVLWTQPHQLGLLLGLVILVFLTRQQLSKDAIFFVVFAIVASVVVPILGIFVVFVLLIAPALWFDQASKRYPQGWTAWIIALAGAAASIAIGLFLSWHFDLASGPIVAVALALFGVGALTLKRNHL